MLPSSSRSTAVAAFSLTCSVLALSACGTGLDPQAQSTEEVASASAEVVRGVARTATIPTSMMVTPMAYFPDQNRILASAGSHLQVVDLARQTTLLTIEALPADVTYGWHEQFHEPMVTSNGASIVVRATYANEIRRYDPVTGAITKAFRIPLASLGGPLVSSATSSDGVHVALGIDTQAFNHSTNRIDVYNVDTGVRELRIDGLNVLPAQIGFVAGGELATTGRLTNALPGELGKQQLVFLDAAGHVRGASAPTNNSSSLQVLASGQTVAWNLQLFSRATMAPSSAVIPVWPLRGTSTFSPDGKQLANFPSYRGQTSYVWNVSTAAKALGLTGLSSGSGVFSANGQEIVAGNGFNLIVFRLP